jgi:hypothetical protein
VLRPRGVSLSRSSPTDSLGCRLERNATVSLGWGSEGLAWAEALSPVAPHGLTASTVRCRAGIPVGAACATWGQ